jgi:hypothetical protein
MKPDNLESQMLRMLDGDLTAEEAAELDQELIASPEARATWRRLAQIHSCLETRFAAKKTINQSTPVPIERVLQDQRSKAIRLSVFAAAAAIVIVGAVLWMIATPDPTPRLATFQVASGSAYALSHASKDKNLRSNTLVEGSTLVIQHGVAEIKLPHDIRAVVEGPAFLTLQDDRTLKFDHGRGLFEITTAKGQGFTVVTPRQRIVDLGTAFAIDVKPGNDAVDLHVIDGHVRVDSVDGNKGEVLQAPRSVKLDGSRISKNIPKANFLSLLPEKLETIFQDDFEYGLLAEHPYSVRMDPSLVTNLKGRRSGGISSDQPWTFRTTSGAPDSIPVRNAGFEEGNVKLSHGKAIPGWHPAIKATGWGTDSSRSGLLPTEGEFLGRVFSGRRLIQKLPVPIVAGTTYILTVDCGFGKNSVSTIRLWGSDAGPDVALAEKTIHSKSSGWKKNQHLVFSATEEHASDQTLGILLTCKSGEFAAFDRIRLGTLDGTPAGLLKHGGMPSATDDKSPPQIISLFPKANSTDFHPSHAMRMVFDQPIRSGQGRVIVRDEGRDTETTLIAGSKLLKFDGETLSFLPRLQLEDGEISMGHLSGWKTMAWSGVFNPSGNGTWYRDDMLDDESDTEGALATMRGPIMATIQPNPSGKGISRDIGTITADTRYMLTAAIGVRSNTPAGSGKFAGYVMRLRSGDSLLAEISNSAPPCAPNNLANVGFSWDSSALPEGVAAGDPLSLEIAPHSGTEGYLDIDAIRVTATALQD